MSLVKIYECLCDLTRLRILNLLSEGEFCVCHLQEILREPQVKISKHLAYLLARGLVTRRKEANWMIYRLPEKPPRELAANLACLQDCAQENEILRDDSVLRRKLTAQLAAAGPQCCRLKPGKLRPARRATA
jgi:ArsR family transcriptional regulator